MTRAGGQDSERSQEERTSRQAVGDSSSRTEEHFRHLVEDLNDVLFALRADGTIDYISPALKTLTGYRPEEVIGRNFAVFVHPDDLAELIASFRRVVAGGLEPSEFRVLHKDGGIRWVRSSSRHAWLHGDVSGTRGVLTDVTERRQTEQLRRENEARFRTLAETTAAITFIHRDEKLLYVNPAGTTVTGYTKEELLQRNFWDLIHPAMRDTARSRAQERLRGAVLPDRTEVKIVAKSGAERWVDFTAATIEYDGEQAIMGTAFDITDRKRALEALRTSEKRFRALIEHSSDLVTLMDEDGIIRYVSPNISRILGYEDQELIGRNGFDPVHPDDVEALLATFQELLREPGTTVIRLYRYRHKDGSWRWMEGVGTNVRGEIEGAAVIANNRDVTDRCHAEEEARRRQAELAHVLRLHVVNEMATALMHEINQPLAAIVNYARGSLLRLERGDPPSKIKHALEQIAGQGIRVGDIVRSLKRFVRKEPPHQVPVDLNELIENVARLVETEARQLGIMLRYKLAPDLPPIEADRVQLEQVILNLLRNGIDAIQSTGTSGRISIETMRCDESSVSAAVSDSGGGLPAGGAEKVFEPFFTTKPKGLGMGLSITRTIVEAHGGRIWAEENASDGGTTFRLVLPSAPDTGPG